MKKLITLFVILLITVSAFGQPSGFSYIKKNSFLEFRNYDALKFNSVVRNFWTDTCVLLRKETYSFVANNKLYCISYDTMRTTRDHIERDVYLYYWNGSAWNKAIREKIQTDSYVYDRNKGINKTQSYIAPHVVGAPFERPADYLVQVKDNGDVEVLFVCFMHENVIETNEHNWKFYYKKLLFTANSDNTTYRFSWDGVENRINTR